VIFTGVQPSAMMIITLRVMGGAQGPFQQSLVTFKVSSACSHPAERDDHYHAAQFQFVARR
jgi:hypothetical protein